jgi:hypothetical protein
MDDQQPTGSPPEETQDPATGPAGDDTSGHSLGYEQSRQVARERAHEVDAWADRQAIAKQARPARGRSLISRIRGR